MRLAPRRSVLILALAVGLAAGPVRAQDLPDSTTVLGRAIAAYRGGRVPDALRLFEEAARAAPRDARAQFYLARVRADSAVGDRRGAERALDRALELDPTNVEYLVAKVVVLRADAPTFLQDRLREQRRLDLARQILRLDSANAFAHEEIGRVAIRDFWRYRNALMVPQFAARARTSSRELGTPPTAVEGSEEDFRNPTGLADIARLENQDRGLRGTDDPNAVFRADRFDVEALRTQGVPVVDLSRRAELAYRRAVGHLRAALATDPFRREVYGDLMRVYALKGEWTEALGMLAGMYAVFPEDPDTWTYFGLAHLRGGNPEGADRAFSTALRFGGPALRRAFESVDLLLPERERAAAAADPAAYAARFWAAQDPRRLTTYNERKLEHFARLAYADLLFAVPALHKRGWETERGRLVVRYGPPPVEVTILPQGFSQSVRRTIFEVPTQTQTLVAADDAQGASGTDGEVQIIGGQLPEPARRRDPEPFNMGDDLNVFNVWDYGTFRFVFEDPLRNGEYRLYSPKASEISDGEDPWINDYELRVRETIRETPERYEYTAPGRQIELPYLVSTFRGADGQTDVLVHYGIAVPRYDSTAERIDLNAQAGTFLVGEDRRLLVERRRTLYGLRTAQIVPFEGTNLWVDTQEMQAPPGNHTLAVEFETGTGGTVAVQRREIRVPDYSAARFAVSDFMLAYHAARTPNGQPLEPGEIVRKGLSIRPAPWSVFNRTRPLYLYFEIYDLTVGRDGRTAYDVELTLQRRDRNTTVGDRVRRVFGRRREGVSVKYPGGGTLRSFENAPSLDASDQPPGLYTLTLRVTDTVGRKTEERNVDLVLE